MAYVNEHLLTKSSMAQVIICGFILMLTFSRCYAEVSQPITSAVPDGDEIVQIVPTQFETIYIPRLGQHIAVYQQSAKSNIIYIQPYLIVDTNHLINQRKAECATASNATKKKEFKLLYHTAQKDIVNDVLTEINKLHPNRNFKSVHSWPYLYIELSAWHYESSDDAFPKQKIISYYPTSGSIGDLSNGAASRNFPQSFSESRLFVTCNELDSIIKTNEFQLRVFTPTQLTTTARIEAIFDGIMSSKEISDLFRVENQDGSIKTTTKSISDSGSVTFSLDKLNGGTGKSTSKIDNQYADSRKRLVNSHALNEAISKSIQNLSIQQYGDLSGLYSIEKVIAYIKGQLESVSSLTPVKIQDGKMFLGEQSRTLSNDEKITLDNFGSLIASANFNSKNEATIPIKGKNVTIKKDNSGDVTITDGRGIKFTQDSSKSWIPTSVDMYIVSENNVLNLLNFNQSTVTIKGGRYLQFWKIPAIKTPPKPNYYDVSMDEFKKNFTDEVTKIIVSESSKLASKLEDLNKGIVKANRIRAPLSISISGAEYFNTNESGQVYADKACKNIGSGYQRAVSYTVSTTTGTFKHNTISSVVCVGQ